MIDCAHIAEQPVDRFGDARQRVTGLAGELGVVEQNLDRPLDLFGDALSGAVTAGEKFEVRQIVVRGRFDPVMDGFVGPQDSAKVLLHDEPVFKDFSTFDAVLVRESQPNVALLRDVSHNLSGLRRSETLMLGEFECRSAFRTAYPLETVHGSAGPTLNRHPLSALDAISLPLFVGQLLRVKTAAAAAVFGVLAPLLPIRSKMAGFQRERVSALQALEPDADGLSFGAAKKLDVLLIALSAAKFVGFSLVFYGKSLAAALAYPLVSVHVYQLLVHVKQYNTLTVDATGFSGAV
jgi:hypothetical protein